MNHLNIDDNTIDKIIQMNGEGILFSLEQNIENIKEIIIYLEEIGIKPINELLIHEIDFFLKDPKEVKELLKKDNIELINNINDDYICIEEL